MLAKYGVTEAGEDVAVDDEQYFKVSKNSWYVSIIAWLVVVKGERRQMLRGGQSVCRTIQEFV